MRRDRQGQRQGRVRSRRRLSRGHAAVLRFRRFGRERVRPGGGRVVVQEAAHAHSADAAIVAAIPLIAANDTAHDHSADGATIVAGLPGDLSLAMALSFEDADGGRSFTTNPVGRFGRSGSRAFN